MLASVEMKKLKTKLKILATNAVDVQLSLLNFNIKDVRQEADQISM